MDVEAQNGHHVDAGVHLAPTGGRGLKKGRSALSKAFLSAGMPVTFKVGTGEPSCARCKQQLLPLAQTPSGAGGRLTPASHNALHLRPPFPLPCRT